MNWVRECRPADRFSRHRGAIGAFAALAIVVLITVGLMRGESSTTTLEFLRIVVSWPAALLVLAIAICFIFRSEVSLLIQRISEIRIPGDMGLSFQQPVPPSVIAGPPGPAEQLPVPTVSVAESKAPEQALERTDAGSAAAATTTDHEKKIAALETEARFWRFSFLIFFLAPETQALLSWLERQKAPVSMSEICQGVAGARPSRGLHPKESSYLEMIEALRGCSLVEYTADGSGYVITALGRNFVGYKRTLEREALMAKSGLTLDQGPDRQKGSTGCQTLAPPGS